jgi:tripartite-type tricarboxylate transporter receptor subunit TctC
MKRSRRKFLRLTAGAAALPALPHVALALDYPTRPVHWVISAAPGGAADILARLMGAWLSERLGEQFIVESHPGAGGNIGTEAVGQVAPDGYTLHLTATSDAINATLYENLQFFVKQCISRNRPRWAEQYALAGFRCAEASARFIPFTTP